MENILSKSCSVVWDNPVSCKEEKVSVLDRLVCWLEVEDTPFTRKTARICCYSAGAYFLAHILKAWA